MYYEFRAKTSLRRKDREWPDDILVKSNFKSFLSDNLNGENYLNMCNYIL